MKKRFYYRLYLHDEAPTIGCGWRIIWLDKAGRKWVKIRDRYTGAPARLSVATWLKLEASPIKVKRAEFARVE